MSTNPDLTEAPRPSFTGPYKKQLAELADLIDWLWAEHGMSWVKAGDEKVYAFGGDGTVLVFDEARWDALIEFVTPKGGVAIRPDAEGEVTVAAENMDEKAVKQLFREGIDALRRYYENRYWRTPRAS